LCVAHVIHKQQGVIIMYKTAAINIRIEPKLKHKTENILHKVGLTSADAVRIYFRQICLCKGLPFDVKIPNKTTRSAMRDANTGKTHKARSIDELFDDLD
jgi:DNA-damage-inducible protein J